MDFSGVLSGLVGAVLSVFLMSVWLKGGKKPPYVDDEGWTHLTNSYGIMAFGVLSFVLGAMFFVLTAISLFNVDSEGFVFWLLFGLPLAWLFLFGAYGIFGVSACFNEEGIKYRRLTQTHFVAWSQISQVIDHQGLGTYLKSDIGRLWIWKYRRGFSELLSCLIEQDIVGARELAEHDFEEIL